jgi:hypothetical protein
MLKKKNPRMPSDYKTLRIRVPAEFDVVDIMKKVQKIRSHLNKSKSSERKMWMKNHVLLEAIEIGLNDLSKK